MRKVLTATVAGLTLAFGLALIGSPASAAPPEEEAKNISLTITDREDTGFGTPSVWATDTLKRTVGIVGGPEYVGGTEEQIRDLVARGNDVCLLVSENDLKWEYKVTVKDTGTFVTEGGRKNSPGFGTALYPDATGIINGGAYAVVTAPAHWCSFVKRYDGATVKGSATGSTGEFIGKLFGVDPVSPGRWTWTYERCVGTSGAEKWVNKPGAVKGQSGDITGKACPTQSPSPSPSTSSPTTPPGNGGGGVVTPSPTVTPSVPGETPEPSLSPVAGVQLPVTGGKGNPVLFFSAISGLLLSAGAILLLAARRRRVA